jgi:hypothetical protein
LAARAPGRVETLIGNIQLKVLADLVFVQHFADPIAAAPLSLVGERAGLPLARGCQLGVRRHDPGGHHAHHEIGLAARA